jgi:hypothetical protein
MQSQGVDKELCVYAAGDWQGKDPQKSAHRPVLSLEEADVLLSAPSSSPAAAPWCE